MISSPAPAGHLYLSGFMGAGKSTVGPLLADRLQRPFIDLDTQIELASGRSIAQIFADDGEHIFRQLEQRALRGLNVESPAVVGLGGGTAIDPENRAFARANGTLVTLQVSSKVVLSRLDAASTDRPLLQGDSAAEDVERLLSTREAAYADADVQVDTDGLTPAAVADETLRATGLGADERVELGERSYQVHFRDNATAELVSRIAGVARDKVLLIADETVAALHARPVLEGCRAQGLDIRLLTFPAGESHKTLDTIGALYDGCLAHRPDRHTPVVALGGGVTGDLAGFVAATLLRGVPYIQAPTTVLAQVDSSVGGKTGFNRAGGKNLVGAFYQPRFVFADAAWLRTLDSIEARSGLAELIKHAVLGDPSLLKLLGAGADLPTMPWLEILPRAVAVKARIVEADEREAGVRALLNFGHTLGHAIEAEAGFGAMRHGEAVSLGMSFAATLSVARAGLSPAERDQLLAALTAVGLPTDWKPWMRPEVLRHMSQDKKLQGETLRYILLERFGAGRIERIGLDEVAGWPVRAVRGDWRKGPK